MRAWNAIPFGWDRLCKVIGPGLLSYLGAGRRGGLRRRLLAWIMKRVRHCFAFFYTVQTTADEERLRSNGVPWPTGWKRAHLGSGVYSWAYLADAREYRRKRRDVPDLRILRFAILRRRLISLRTIDVDAEPNPDEWMNRYSLLGTDQPLEHRAAYVRRHTDISRGIDTAVEHFFSKTVFPYLGFCRGTVRAD